MIKEITFQELDAERFIEEKVREIRAAVGDGTAINELPAGVAGAYRLWANLISKREEKK